MPIARPIPDRRDHRRRPRHIIGEIPISATLQHVGARTTIQRVGATGALQHIHATSTEQRIGRTITAQAVGPIATTQALDITANVITLRNGAVVRGPVKRQRQGAVAIDVIGHV